MPDVLARLTGDHLVLVVRRRRQQLRPDAALRPDVDGGGVVRGAENELGGAVVSVYKFW